MVSPFPSHSGTSFILIFFSNLNPSLLPCALTGNQLANGFGPPGPPGGGPPGGPPGGGPPPGFP